MTEGQFYRRLAAAVAAIMLLVYFGLVTLGGFIRSEQVEACGRGNTDLRAPLSNWAALRLIDDEVSADERAALREIRDNTIVRNCEAEIDKPQWAP